MKYLINETDVVKVLFLVKRKKNFYNIIKE